MVKEQKFLIVAGEASGDRHAAHLVAEIKKELPQIPTGGAEEYLKTDLWESLIKCNYIKCAAGHGVSGNGKCFLGGYITSKHCSKFRDEEKELNSESYKRDDKI